jgi:hypothetical protein
LPGRIRQNGRYFLLISASPLSKTLPIRGRDWLSSLLSDGRQDINIDLSKEPPTLCNAVGTGFKEQPDLQVRLKTKTLAFEPELTIPSPVFWGYLVRILAFSITTLGQYITYDDVPGDHWDAGRADALSAVQQNIISRF